LEILDDLYRKVAIAAWKKMPVFLTTLIGPGIVKNLP